MPELPEVEGVRRTLRDGNPSLIGKVILSVDVIWDGVVAGSEKSEFSSLITGRQFTGIDRHGKYLLFQLTAAGSDSPPLFLVVHLRMTGRLTILPQGSLMGRHARLAVTLDSGDMLTFDDPRKFGRVWLVNSPDTVKSCLGPDALTVDENTFLCQIRNHRRRIKALLLDQSVIAGVGNIYADESLFRARIHPETVSDRLAEKQLKVLYRAVTGVMKEAVDLHGANIDGVFKEGGFIVSVYGQTGRPCPVCGTPIVKIRSGQRGTHFCPRCQPAQHKYLLD
ncbi:MAG: DNA-formamidopyrimidine glycosylase [Desulfuromonadales bacterium]